jgi:hypothetical protein
MKNKVTKATEATAIKAERTPKIASPFDIYLEQDTADK